MVTFLLHEHSFAFLSPILQLDRTNKQKFNRVILAFKYSVIYKKVLGITSGISFASQGYLKLLHINGRGVIYWAKNSLNVLYKKIYTCLISMQL